MKKLFLLFIAMMLGIMLSGQTQQGYVKTKGRMVNGQLVPGQGLKWATVSIKGRTTVLVNSDDGAFSFPVPEAQFRLDSVSKKGYQLVDMDACSRTYKHSVNPIYLVMETPEQQLQDQLAAERKIRRTLTDQLHQREDEIEALKEQKKITDEEYRQALQKLYEETSQNDQLIKNMAKRYSELDYDQLDDFYRKVSYCIENGELLKADSLLRSRGDINKQVEDILQRGQALQEEKDLLQKAEAVQEADIEEAARRCYSYYETFTAQYQNDSAAYFIELRARLDTLNALWQIQAGEFIWEYYHFNWTDCMVAYKYFLRALSVSEPMSEMSGRACYNIGRVYAFFKDYSQAFQGYQLALLSAISIYGEIHPYVAKIYQAIGSLYLNQEDYSNATNYFLLSLKTNKLCFGDSHQTIAEAYNELANICLKSNHINEAFTCYRSAIDIYTQLYGPNCIGIARTDINIGKAYMQQDDYETALNYVLDAVNIYQILYNDTHPDWIELFTILGDIYTKLNEERLAFQYYEKAFKIREKTEGGDAVFRQNKQGAVLYIPGALHRKTKDVLPELDSILNNTK